MRVKIEQYAREYGLDFYETIFEILDFEEMNMVAAYGGFPNRYPHWKFGMEYERLNKSYAYGLHKIYEMVINNDPCYAYLLECNHARRSEDRHGPRVRPLRLLQEQHLVLEDQSQNDGHDGEPRHEDPQSTSTGMASKPWRHSWTVCLSLEDLIDHHSPVHRAPVRNQLAADHEATPSSENFLQRIHG